MNLQATIYHTARVILEFFQDQWFDRTRRIRTAGDVSLSLAGILAEDTRDSEHYVPARPHHVREALRAVPVQDESAYTYIDLGSGKGRTLFIAAEFPYRQIVGVELSKTLHEKACASIRSFRNGRAHRNSIRSLQENAADFHFPEGPLVVYLFNPFGRSTMQQVLQNLGQSLLGNPRHVVVVLLWPRCGDLVAAVEGMHLVCAHKRYEIFEAHPQSPA